MPEQFVAVLAAEGEQTGDGRMIAEGALTWAEVPFPIMSLLETPGLGSPHSGAQLAARVDEVRRVRNAIVAIGTYDSGERGVETARLVREGFLNGISIDPDDVDFEIHCLREETEEFDGEEYAYCAEELFVMTSGRIRGATIAPFQAIMSARVAPAGDDPEAAILTLLEGVPAPVAPPGGDPDVVILTASGVVPDELPPREAFEVPEPDHLVPPTIDAQGRFVGHLAPWGVCHTAHLPRCVTAPHSSNGYADFHRAHALVRCCENCDEGRVETVAVGRITVGGMHASPRLGGNIDAVLRHYEDVSSAVVDVRATDGRLGIWLCGAVRPSATPDQVAMLRGSPLSGDWRAEAPGKPLELRVAHAVNVPGFPVPVAEGNVSGGDDPMALVAGGRRVRAPRPRLVQDMELHLGTEALVVLDQFERRLATLEAMTEPMRDEYIARLAAGLAAGVEAGITEGSGWVAEMISASLSGMPRQR